MRWTTGARLPAGVSTCDNPITASSRTVQFPASWPEGDFLTSQRGVDMLFKL